MESKENRNKSSEKKESNEKNKMMNKKNQIIIAALTVLLGVAGYMNFSDSSINLSDDRLTEEVFVENEYIEGEDSEISEKITVADMDVENEYLEDSELDDADSIELNSDEDSIGEAVLTSANAVNRSFANIKLSREQSRSKSKEYYLDIINSDSMDEGAVQSATDAYIRLTEDMEKEAEAEAILNAKGFAGALVCMGEDSVDVVITANELSDTDKAKVEDIVTRKTGCRVEQINITTVAE